MASLGEAQLHQGSLFEIANADRFSRYIQLLHKMSRSLITLQHSNQRDSSNIDHLIDDLDRLRQLSHLDMKHPYEEMPLTSISEMTFSAYVTSARTVAVVSRTYNSAHRASSPCSTISSRAMQRCQPTHRYTECSNRSKIKSDSMSMKIIAAVTLLYLPATFVSSLFGTNLVAFDTNGPEPMFLVSKLWWVYVVFAVPLTVGTMGGFVVWRRYRDPIKRGSESIFCVASALATRSVPRPARCS